MSGGYGDGGGYGCGYGDGGGYGCGYGDGYGYGDGGVSGGRPLGAVAGMAVTTMPPWPIIKIGCQTWSVDAWRDTYENLARKYSVSTEDVARIRAMVESYENSLGRFASVQDP